MRVEFSIRASSAVARGLRGRAEWLAWVAKPIVPAGNLEFDISHVPAMVRRRLSPLARMAVVVADDVLQQAQLSDVPIVWASRYGDVEKSLDLLRHQVRAEPLSPTTFGLSVHNGIGAQHSILRGMVSNAICVASLDAAPEAGIVETLGLLHEGASDVMLVCYDEPLPGEYAQFSEVPAAEFAWAVLLTATQNDLPTFALTAGSNDVVLADDGACSLPHGLQVLRFLLDTVQSRFVHMPARGGCWTWERLHA